MKKTILIILIIFAAILLAYQAFFGKNEATGEAALSWNANAEPDLAGYRIYYGTKPRTGDCPPGGYSDNVAAGKEISYYNISGLEDGKTYYFSVTSYNQSGKESCFSEESQKTISISGLSKLKIFLGKLNHN